jgi:hypothetical protein
MVADCSTGFAQRDHLSVRCGIGFGKVTVESPANDFSATNYHGSYRNFARPQSLLSAAKSLMHPEFVGSSGVIVGGRHE